MVSKAPKKNDSSTKSDPVRALRFLEELSWLLQTYQEMDLKAISRALTDAADQRTVRRGFSSFASPNPNIHFLVGIIPLVLRDETLFPTNGTIADFATFALEMDMSGWKKKSRYELIGEIVCNTVDLDDSGLNTLVEALSVLARGDSKTKSIVRTAQDSSRNWNEIIQLLTLNQK